ncbi:hypothetical protein [Chitinophaga sancti]|uniref:ATP synthase I chain n=1 Tax=Chitinophaga sancti TaxID=1004 RepID=A0A1K1R6Q4_9BACT|nr:hypothetical protein [Chitinophaga sancti]WQD64168.1 hypothetical protein U0033_07155 [Chitinophaga sancti]WQG90208.1 hypothetical protein SR876_01765 [Chitinophaga sancti]SFW67784.1 hypothetical protein SAMN05661012_03478 [Chitinophaga sancti]
MEDLLGAWHSVNTTSAIHAGLLRERQHPVLKKIRKQMVIELIGFVLFLSVYYNFFDGAQKPVYANVLLITAMLVVIAVNIVGYVFAKQGVPGENVRELLEKHLIKMRIYAIVSVFARALMMTAFVVFFKGNVIVVVLFVGLFMALVRLWVVRIRNLKTVYKNF